MNQYKSGFVYSSKSNLIFSSSNCSSSTFEGEFIIKSIHFQVFGKAYTSLTLSSSVNIIITLSIPIAKPPCGGTQYWKASYIAPNFSFTSSSVLQTFLNASTKVFISVFLIEPDKTS